MIKRIVLALLAVGTVAPAAVACGTSHQAAYYDTVCIDPLTQIRMPDYYCQVGNIFYNPAWVYYVHPGIVFGGYGARVNNFTTIVNNHTVIHTRPANATIHTGGIPATGGQATRAKTGNVTTNKQGIVRTPPPPDKIGSTTRQKVSNKYNSPPKDYRPPRRTVFRSRH